LNGRGVELQIVTLDTPSKLTGKRDSISLDEVLEPPRQWEKERHMGEKCNVEFREGKPMCTVHHDVALKETGAIEIHPPQPNPHSYQPTSYFCPISGQQFPHIKGVPPLR
jgi:hypothetical protein